MKRLTLLVLILALLAMPFAAGATSLADIGDKPEPAPRTMPEPTVENIPLYDSDGPSKFLGKIILPNDTTGLGYEFGSFPSDPWKRIQALIRYNNRLIEAGYDAPSFGEFDGDNQQYILFSSNKQSSVYLLPYLKENTLIAIIKYSRDILEAFPDETGADDAYAALTEKLDGEDMREAAAGMLAQIWKTSGMKRTVSDRITADNAETLLPLLIRSDYYTRFKDDGEVNAAGSVSDLGNVIRGLIGGQETPEGMLSMAKKMAGGVLPAVDERYLTVSSLVKNSTEMETAAVTEQFSAVPAFDKDAEIPKDATDDGAAHKYVLVSENDGKYYLMAYHSMFLPAEEIAESIGEADRIIVCHNYYKKSSGNWIGGTPSDSMTRINLYDANGGFICSLGLAANYQGMVSHGGLPHDWMEMGEKISAYFADK